MSAPPRLEPAADLIDAWCGNCHAETMVRADRLCPSCGRLTTTTSSLAVVPAAGTPVSRVQPKPEAQASRSIVLPHIREAVRLDTALDAVLTALEREEEDARTAFEGAKERYRTARAAAADMRQMRALVKVADEAAETDRPKRSAAQTDGGKRWSRKFAACVLCGTTDRKHVSLGRCTTCQKKPLGGAS